MKYNLQIIPKTLHFKQPAGTSRGVYHTRQVWYLLLTDTDSGRYGVGECAPLPDLSCDALPDYEHVLTRLCRTFEAEGRIDYDSLRPYPSVLFGLETALLHLQAGGVRFFPTPFAAGEEGIPINGLIWMGNFDEMARRLEEKMKLGFRCIKLKIGAIDFDREVALLERVRQRFSPREVELRVDANGAFSPADARQKLETLSRFCLHSIEQPIRAGQWEEMRKLCQDTPIPIALDEELIGVNRPEEKARLLDTVRPQYIILKPSLHGGLKGAEEWIRLAGERGIGSWVTSALESNVGLNSIAQWCATLNPQMPQGLGTGQLFTDNIPYPLDIQSDCLWFLPGQPETEFGELLCL